jgi:hypothetical protein
LVDGNRYLDYHVRPKEISIDKYLKVYDAFCNAYGIKIDETDRHMFSREIQKKILTRHKPESVDYRPVLSGNKTDARLMVIPLKDSYVRFGALSYDKEHDYIGKFIKLAGKILFKPETLENKIE